MDYRFTQREVTPIIEELRQINSLKEELQRRNDALGLYIRGVMAARDLDGEYELSSDGQVLIEKRKLEAAQENPAVRIERAATEVCRVGG